MSPPRCRRGAIAFESSILSVPTNNEGVIFLVEEPKPEPEENEPFNIETKTLKEAIDKSDDPDEVFNMDNVVDDPTDL